MTSLTQDPLKIPSLIADTLHYHQAFDLAHRINPNKESHLRLKTVFQTQLIGHLQTIIEAFESSDFKPAIPTIPALTLTLNTEKDKRDGDTIGEPASLRPDHALLKNSMHQSHHSASELILWAKDLNALRDLCSCYIEPHDPALSKRYQGVLAFEIEKTLEIMAAL